MLALLPFLMTVLAVVAPSGWLEVPAPSEALLNCANHSDREWRVSAKGELTIKRARDRDLEADVGPSLPFDPGLRGRTHVVRVSTGYLIGSSAGEWGGRLISVDQQGKDRRELSSHNVVGLIRRGPRTVLALTGLNHLSMHEGAARWFQLDAHGTWIEERVVALDSGPSTYVVVGDVVYVLTMKSLVQIRGRSAVNVVKHLPLDGLYPNSMAATSDGTLWAGMRHFVLALVPDGSRFKPTWWVPTGCEQTRLTADEDCRCISKKPASQPQ